MFSSLEQTREAHFNSESHTEGSLLIFYLVINNQTANRIHLHLWGAHRLEKPVKVVSEQQQPTLPVFPHQKFKKMLSVPWVACSLSACFPVFHIEC